MLYKAEAGPTSGPAWHLSHFCEDEVPRGGGALVQVVHADERRALGLRVVVEVHGAEQRVPGA